MGSVTRLPSRIPADPGRIVKLEEDLDAAMRELRSDRQRAFVRVYSRTGDAVFSCVEAGYSRLDAKDRAQRLRREPHIRAALKVASELRDATTGLSKSGWIQLLEAALEVRWSDFYEFDNDGRTPVALRPIETWSLPMQLRVKKLPTSKAHRSAKGERGHTVFFNDDCLIPAVEIGDRLAKLRRWEPDARMKVDLAARRVDRHPGSETDAEKREAAAFYDELGASLPTPDEEGR